MMNKFRMTLIVLALLALAFPAFAQEGGNTKVSYQPSEQTSSNTPEMAMRLSELLAPVGQPSSTCAIGRYMTVPAETRYYLDAERLQEAMVSNIELVVFSEGCQSNSVSFTHDGTTYWVDYALVQIVEPTDATEVYPFGSGPGCEFAEGFNGTATSRNMALAPDALNVYHANPSAQAMFNGTLINLRETLVILPPGMTNLPNFPGGSMFSYQNNAYQAAGAECLAAQMQFFRWDRVVVLESYDSRTRTLVGTEVFLPGEAIDGFRPVIDAISGEIWWAP